MQESDRALAPKKTEKSFALKLFIACVAFAVVVFALSGCLCLGLALFSASQSSSEQAEEQRSGRVEQEISKDLSWPKGESPSEELLRRWNLALYASAKAGDSEAFLKMFDLDFEAEDKRPILEAAALYEALRAATHRADDASIVAVTTPLQERAQALARFDHVMRRDEHDQLLVARLEMVAVEREDGRLEPRARQVTYRTAHLDAQERPQPGWPEVEIAVRGDQVDAEQFADAARLIEAHAKHLAEEPRCLAHYEVYIDKLRAKLKAQGQSKDQIAQADRLAKPLCSALAMLFSDEKLRMTELVMTPPSKRNAEEIQALVRDWTLGPWLMQPLTVTYEDSAGRESTIQAAYAIDWTSGAPRREVLFYAFSLKTPISKEIKGAMTFRLDLHQTLQRVDVSLATK